MFIFHVWSFLIACGITVHGINAANNANDHRNLTMLIEIHKNPNQQDHHSKDGKFGEVFTDHMLEYDWNITHGWFSQQIKPFGPLQIHPASKVLHYAIETFDGFKAYLGDDGKVRIFRLKDHLERFKKNAARVLLPGFEVDVFAKHIIDLVKLDKSWVPRGDYSALYIRPALIAIDPRIDIIPPNAAKMFVIMTPEPAEFLTHHKEIKCLYADSQYVRAFPGGVGAFKLGANYAPALYVTKKANELGCEEVLWLHGTEQDITEIGTQNFFAIFASKQPGKVELATPPVSSGLILAGIVRDTVLKLARDFDDVIVREKIIDMDIIHATSEAGVLLGAFGTGTALTMTPIRGIKFRDVDGTMEDIAIPHNSSETGLFSRLRKALMDVQYGRSNKHPEWITVVD